jgi:F-type H+-transporting ATPase subunit delta
MPGRKPPTPRRYAQAIFQLALEEGGLEEWRGAIEEMTSAINNEETVSLLESPNLSAKEKQEVIRKVFPSRSTLATNFLALLAHQKGVGLLPRIQESLRKMFDDHQGIIRATVTTAVTLSDAEKEQIQDSLKQKWEREVALGFNIDLGIVGGMVIRIGDKVIDGSTKGRLRALRLSLQE